MISKTAIRKVIAQARGCVKGDLHLDADGKTISFVIGTTDSSESGRTYNDFWLLAKEHSFEKVAAIIRRWAESK